MRLQLERWCDAMTIRITPIPDKPVRTVSAYRKREAAKQQAALHEKLMREVKESRNEQADAARN